MVAVYSCQKELSPDALPVSQGFLLKDSFNNCRPIKISGEYYRDQNFSDSNYLLVDVDVTSSGSFKIFTDTINGFWFATSGNFNNTGLMHIKLIAHGIPLEANTSYFTITYNNSTCEATIIVKDSLTNEAGFTIEGSPNNCSNDTVYGSYIKGLDLDSNAKIKISVNVSKPGSYRLSTNTINGYSFSASGVFKQTGVQTIFMYSAGKPVSEGLDVFVINTTESLCNFPVKVLTAITGLGNDYFPLTANSYWIYDDFINKGDSIRETITGSTNLNNGIYTIMKEDVSFGGPFQYFYRKTDGYYFEYAAPNKYTSFFQYKKPVYDDISFLKENLATNDFWESPEYIDSTSTGNIISLKYNFTCLNANAVVTVNEKAFSNVYEIRMIPLVRQMAAYNATGEEYIFYYAKGIGLIYLKKTLGSFVQKELKIKSWKVN